MTIGASNAYAFFGVNGPHFDTNNDGKVDANDHPEDSTAMGLAISNVTVGIAIMKPVNANGTLAPVKSFFAMKASGNVALVGIDGFDASITNATVEINQGTPAVGRRRRPRGQLQADRPGRRAADPRRPGPRRTVHSPPRSSTSTSPARVFRASGTITLTIGEFVRISGNVAFEKGETYTGRVNGAATDSTYTVLKIGASNVNIFAGIGGIDANGDGVITATDPGAKGLALSNAELRARAVQAHHGRLARLLLRAARRAPPRSAGRHRGRHASPPTTSRRGQRRQRPGPAQRAAAEPLRRPRRDGPDRPVLEPDARLRRPACCGSAARVTLDVGDARIKGGIFFEQTTRTNGTKVIKIALQGVDIFLGSEAEGFKITGASGLIFITNLGMAAQFNVPVNIAFGGDAFVFNGTLEFGINNTTGRRQRDVQHARRHGRR